MGFCVKCNKFYHPDYCVDIISNDNKTTGKICLFCKLNKKVLTIEDKNGNIVKQVTKKEASNMYMKYIKKLEKQQQIESIIKTGNLSRIILP